MMRRIMNRMISAVLAIVMSLSLVCVPVGAAQVNSRGEAKAVVTVGNGTITGAGQTVIIPVSLELLDETVCVDAVGFEFVFDSNLRMHVPANRFDTTVDVTNTLCESVTADPVNKKVAYAAQGGTYIDQFAIEFLNTSVLFNLKMDAAETYVNGTYPIEIRLIDNEEGSFAYMSEGVDVYFVPGSITLSGGLNKADLVPDITTQPANASYTYNADIAPLSVVANAPAVCDGLKYQWFKNTTNSNVGGTKIADATQATYTPAKDYGTYYYYCVVTTTYQDAPYSTTSNAAAVTYSRAALPGDKVSLNQTAFTYNGQAQNPVVTVTGLVEGEDYTLSGDLSKTDAGTYTITVTGKGDYEGIITKEWTIDPKQTKIPTAKTGLVYTGSDQTGVETEEGCSVTDATKKDAGTYTAVATLKANYIWEDGSKEAKRIGWTIEPAKAEVIWNVPSMTYDGTAQAPTATFKGVGADGTIRADVAGAKKDAGTGYTATASTANKNYTLTNETTAFAINPMSIPVVWSATELRYNGKMQAPSATVTAGVAGDSLKAVISGSAKDVGTSYVATATSSNPNYTLTNATVVFSISSSDVFDDVTTKKQNVVIEVGSFTEPKFTGYDGEIVSGTTTYTYKDKNNAVAVAKTADQINAALKLLAKGDVAEIGYSFTTAGNYSGTKTGTIEVTMVDIIFKVDDAEATLANALTITDPTYGDNWGSIIKISDKIAASVDGNPVSGKFSLNWNETVVPKAGKQSFALMFYGDDARYAKVEVLKGQVEVAPKPVAVEWTNTELTYTGEPQLPTGTYTDIDDQPVGVTVTATGEHTNVGEYEATASTADKNYKLTNETTAFAIKPAAAEMTITVKGTEDCTKGTELTAETEGKFDVLAYQWLKDGQPIEGATAQKYTIAAGMAGSLISVQVTSSGNYAGKATSVGAEVGRIQLTATVAIDGEAALGSVLTATVAGEGTCDIVWLANGVVIEGASGENYTVAKADQGKQVTAKIVGTGDYKGEAVSNGIDIPAGKPDAPVLTAGKASRRVNLSWTVPVDNGAAITGYQIKVDNGEWISVAAGQTEYQVTDLMNGTTYNFYIKAINAVGESEVATASARPSAPLPSTPVNPGTGSGSGSGTTKPEPEQPKDNVTTKTDSAGNKVTTTVAENGSVTVQADLNEKAVASAIKGDTAVKLPMDSVNTGKATEVTVNTGAKEPVKVAIPVSAPQAGTVAAVIGADGEQKVVRDCVTTEDGVIVSVNDGDKVVLVNNSKTFADVPASHWGKKAVDFAYSRGLFYGVSETKFAPEVAMNRAMIAQVLYNLNYMPNVGVTSLFPDVSAGDWFGKAVAWAAGNGIVSGYGDGQYRPDKEVAREELVVMLWNYSGKPAAQGDLTVDFADGARVSDWAKAAMNWALANGVLGGKGGKMLDPQGLATRVEVAQMMKNYLENI